MVFDFCKSFDLVLVLGFNVDWAFWILFSEKSNQSYAIKASTYLIMIQTRIGGQKQIACDILLSFLAAVMIGTTLATSIFSVHIFVLNL